MNAEIVAQLGLDHARFDRGLAAADRGWESWAQKLRTRPVQIVPEKSARDSAKVFEDISRAREQHLGDLDRGRIERALGQGAGAVSDQRRSAAESARVFEESARQQQQQQAELSSAEQALAAAKKRNRYEEASTVGRIKIVQGELVGLARQRDSQQRGTVERLRTELQIEERLGRLRSLQRQQQAATVAVLPPIAQVERQANGIIGVLRRKFGTADVFKDTLKSFGAAGVGGIVGGITSFFSRGADRASGAEQLNATTATNLRGTLSTLGGMSVRIREARREFNDLGQQIEMTEKTLQELEANPLALVHPLWQQQVDKVRSDLNAMKGQYNAVGNEVTVLTREHAYQSSLLEEELDNIDAMNRMRAKGASEIQLANRQLLDLEGKLLLARINKRPVEEQQAITAEIKRQQGAVEELRRAARRARSAVVGDLTQQAASSDRRYGNGAPRGLTETERLARRARANRQSAADAVLTSQPQLARDALRAAERDESTVAGRLRSATRLVAKDQSSVDAGNLRPELVNANKILTSIDASLKRTNVSRVFR